MKKDPLISIYITSHNYGDYIEDAIMSAINQSYSNKQIIIYDDCSGDNSRDIISKYENHRDIEVFFGDKIKGLRGASNFCIEKAKGEFVIRLDADDKLHENFLELAVKEINSDQRIEYIFTNYFYIDEFTKTIGVEILPKLNDRYEATSFPPHGACCIVKKSIYENHGYYDESLSRQDGHELWMKIILQKINYTHLDLPLFYYRKHGDSLSSNKKYLFRDRSEIKNKLNVTDETRNICFIPIRKDIFERFDPIRTKILSNLIEEVKTSGRFQKIVISTDSDNIIEYLSDSDVIDLHDRRSISNSGKTEVNDAIIDFVSTMTPSRDDYDYFLIMNLTNIRTNHIHIIEAINSMSIYELDSLVSVYKEESVLYQMSELGMNPINYDNQFKLRKERDAVFVHNGAIKVLKMKYLLKDDPYGEKIGHIEMTREDSVFIKNQYEADIYLNNHA